MGVYLGNVIDDFLGSSIGSLLRGGGGGGTPIFGQNYEKCTHEVPARNVLRTWGGGGRLLDSQIGGRKSLFSGSGVTFPCLGSLSQIWGEILNLFESSGLCVAQCILL